MVNDESVLPEAHGKRLPQQREALLLMWAQFMCPMQSEVKPTKMSKFGTDRGLLQGHVRRQVGQALKALNSPEGFSEARWGRRVQGKPSVCAQISDWLMVKEQGGVTGVNIISP